MADLYELYIRTKSGNTYSPKDIRSALRDFLGDDGYRLSFNVDGVVITLRRDMQVDADMRFLDRELNSESVDCAVTFRGHNGH